MSDTVSDLLLVTLVSLGVAAVAMLITALVARRIGRVNVVDVTWGLALAGVAIACALIAGTGQSWLLAALVVVWGGRLSWHIHRRSRGQGEDPRYAEMLGEGGFATAVRRVFAVQGAAIWLVSWPLQAAAICGLEWTWALWAGVVVWAVGVFFESVGDAQLAAYKRKEDRPPVLDTGLWGWTRHPNYFGDACVWWGLWLVGGLASGWLPALITVAAPIMMTHFVRNVTGAKLLERSMMKRPAFAEYAERVPLFVPRPPRR